MNRYSKLPNPLNPPLYEMLWAETRGDVNLVNPGSRLRARIEQLPGKGQVVKSLGGSEEYAINCPMCGDSRHRCQINHALGTTVNGIKVRYLAHCFNENCRGLYEWVMEKLEKYSGREGVTPPAYSAVPAAAASGPLDIHAIAKEAAEKHERLSGVQPLETLPADHKVLAYVRGRGFDPGFLSGEFGVGFASSGDKAGRLVIPVFFEGVEVGWTARAIPNVTGTPRPYNAHKYINASCFPKSKFLYNYDRAREYEVIALAEGVTDVWKIGLWGMALFGKHMSAAQCDLLCSAAEAKKAWIVLLGDASTERDAAASAWKQNFQMIRAKYKYPSRLRLHLFDVGDPGDRTTEELHGIVRCLEINSGGHMTTRPKNAKTPAVAAGANEGRKSAALGGGAFAAAGERAPSLNGLAKCQEARAGMEIGRPARYLSSAGNAYSPPRYHYLLDAGSLRPALEYCRPFPATAVDCEWEGESPRAGGRLLTIQFSVRPREAFVAVLNSGAGDRKFSPAPATAIEMLRDLLLRPDIAIIGQNFRAALEWLIPLGLDLTAAYAERGFDVALVSHLLAEEEPCEPAPLALRYTDMGRNDAAARRLPDRGSTRAKSPDEVLWRSAAEGADALMRMYPALRQALWDDHLRAMDAMPLEGGQGDWLLSPDEAAKRGKAFCPSLWTLFRHVVMPATVPLKEVELEGMPVDQDRLRDLARIFTRRRDRLGAELRELAGDPDFNPNSPVQVREVLFGDPNAAFVGLLEDYRSVNAMAVNQLAEPAPGEAGAPARGKGLAAHIDSDGRVRTVISQLTETGRYRSSRPNLTNIPRSREGNFARIFGKEAPPPVRSMFQAPAGGVYIEADMKAAELFTLAHLAGDAEFKSALAARDKTGEPLSFHTTAMCRFFKLRISPEAAAAAMDSGTAEGERLKGLRTAAKSVVFGILYGRGAAAICQAVKREGVACAAAEARKWIDGYRETFPRAWYYLDECKRRARETGLLTNPYGRIRRFAPSDDPAAIAAQEREARNFPIQSTVADSLSLALCRLVRERDRRGMGTRLVLPIHDAILLWAPYEEIQAACRLLRWAVTDAPGAEVPRIGLRYEVELAFYQRWNEQLDPARLADIAGVKPDSRQAG
ncbi:MAG: hypothetical protein LBT97_09065 [Planctomycetota bacterium]|nr:hypothetical protein [Planctomycetota bacterium]